jgi:hypothetical protein
MYQIGIMNRRVGSLASRMVCSSNEEYGTIPVDALATQWGESYLFFEEAC